MTLVELRSVIRDIKQYAYYTVISTNDMILSVRSLECKLLYWRENEFIIQSNGIWCSRLMMGPKQRMINMICQQLLSAYEEGFLLMTSEEYEKYMKLQCK